MIFQNYVIDSSTKLSNNNLQSSIDDPLSSLIGIGIVILSFVLILFALKNYRDAFKAINARDYKPKNTTIYYNRNNYHFDFNYGCLFIIYF
jgi:uncharacterized membrane protein YidH (DUF202 family)